MQSRTVKGVERYLYDNEEEFRKYHPSADLVRNWKEGEAGDWVLLNDGKVTEILRTGEIHTKYKTQKIVTTIVGTSTTEPSDTLYGDPNPKYYSFIKRKDVDRRRKWLNKEERVFALFVASGSSPEEAVRKVWRNVKNPKLKASRLMAQERIVNAVRKEIKETLDALGISKEYVFQRIKDIIDNGERESSKVSLLKELIEVLELKEDNKQQSTMMLYSGFTDEQLKAVGVDPAMEIEAPKDDEATAE